MNAVHVGRDTMQRTVLVQIPMHIYFLDGFPDVIILKGETCLIGDQIKHVS